MRDILIIPKSITLPITDCTQVGAFGASIWEDVVERKVAPSWASSNCKGSILKSPNNERNVEMCNDSLYEVHAMGIGPR